MGDFGISLIAALGAAAAAAESAATAVPLAVIGGVGNAVGSAGAAIGSTIGGEAALTPALAPALAPTLGGGIITSLPAFDAGMSVVGAGEVATAASGTAAAGTGGAANAAALMAGLGIASTAGMAGLSVLQASEKNKALKKAQSAAADAAGVQEQQVSDQAALERYKAINRGNLIQSRLRVAAGEAGIGLGGTYAALARQADYDAAMNDLVVGVNRRNTLASIRSGGKANIISLASQRDNPALAGITGGIQGFGLGLGLANGIIGIDKAGATPQDPSIFT